MDDRKERMYTSRRSTARRGILGQFAVHGGNSMRSKATFVVALCLLCSLAVFGQDGGGQGQGRGQGGGQGRGQGGGQGRGQGGGQGGGQGRGAAPAPDPVPAMDK